MGSTQSIGNAGVRHVEIPVAEPQSVSRACSWLGGFERGALGRDKCRR